MEDTHGLSILDQATRHNPREDFSLLRLREFRSGDQQDGAVRPTADLLCLPGPVPDTQDAALPTQLLSGALHGGTRGLRQEAGQVSGV